MVSEESKNCINCAQHWSNFANLNEEQLERVNKTRYEARFKAREVIFKQGSPTSNGIILATGLAKVHIEGYDGKNIILNIIKPRRMISGPGSFVDNRNYYSLTAITDVVACFVDLNVLKGLILENNKFAEGYIKFISQKSINIFNKLVSATQKKMHGRLAEGLLFLANDIFESDKFENILSRQELGELTNMTKESVVRVLKEFNDEHIIHLENDSIEILDKTRLQKIMTSG
jgi:CRP/FNR family transcriptional regulator, polysaccharide utilization system transcription regulator